MKNVADVEGDALPKSAAVGEDLDQALLTVGGVDGDEAMVKGRSLGFDGHEAELFESCTQRRGDQYRFVVINFREQVDIVGEA